MSQRYGDQSGAESTDCVPTCCVQDQNGSSGTNRTANKHSAHEDRVQSVPRFGPKRINHLGGHDAAQPPGQRDHHDLGDQVGGLNPVRFRPGRPRGRRRSPAATPPPWAIRCEARRPRSSSCGCWPIARLRSKPSPMPIWPSPCASRSRSSWYR